MDDKVTLETTAKPQIQWAGMFAPSCSACIPLHIPGLEQSPPAHTLPWLVPHRDCRCAPSNMADRKELRHASPHTWELVGEYMQTKLPDTAIDDTICRLSEKPH